MREVGGKKAACSKRRIPNERIKPSSLDHDFRELQRPVERRLTVQPNNALIPKVIEIAMIEMHGDLDGGSRLCRKTVIRSTGVDSVG